MEIAGLLLPISGQDFLAVLLGFRAVIAAIPGMTQDIAGLEIRTVAGLMQAQIVGKSLGVILEMEAGNKDVDLRRWHHR